MRLLLLAALATVSIISADGQAVIEVETDYMRRTLRQLCMDETGVDEELILMANRGVLVPDEKMKCYFKCVMVNAGVMSLDGVVLEDNFIRAIPEPQSVLWSEAIWKCKTQVGIDMCDIAFQTQSCYQRHNPLIYFVP